MGNTRAIVLAAGVGKRMAPLSYELPKALLNVRGEVLIDRLIRQLHEAGVKDITVVLGYMKESLFYLEEELGVNFRVNPQYADTSSAESLYLARDVLPGSWVCSTDQYFSKNPFLLNDTCSVCSVVAREVHKREIAVQADIKGKACAAGLKVDSPYVLQGPAFFSHEDGLRFAHILEFEHDKPNFSSLLWDNIWAEHVNELPLKLRVIDERSIHEFKSFNDLVEFDRDFVENVDLSILDNICLTLDCARSDVSDVVPIKQGLTNLSFRFVCKGTTYVYRHPGAGTDEIINREAETRALEIARDLGLDATFVYEDPEQGWKLSRYIDGCEEFDYSNQDHVRKAFVLARRLHESGEQSPWSFDYLEEGKKIIQLLKHMHYPLPKDFDTLAGKIERIAHYMKTDGGKPVLCHNDFYGPNLLVRGEDMWLIDWEYSAMGDYACDIGNFVAQGSQYSVEETIAALELYYGRPASSSEIRHCLAAVALVGWYWYVWAIYKGAKGNPVGEWLYIWYKAANSYCAAALPLYEEA